MESIIIGIAGGSGSGKSTFTNRLKKHFGDDVVVIYHDNYYRRQDGIPFEERVKVNYDHPDSLETDLLHWKPIFWSSISKNSRRAKPSNVRYTITVSTTAPTKC